MVAVKRSNARRIAVRLVVFLLLGLVTNVAVAWGCCAYSAQLPTDNSSIYSLWDSIPPTDEDRSWLADNQWESRAPYSDYVYRVASRQIGGIGLTRKAFMEWGQATTATKAKARPQVFFAIRNWTGWPARCMYSEQWMMNRRTGGTYESRLSVATVHVQHRWNGYPFTDTRALAGLPLFPGFLINTLFYAVLLWLLWSAPFATRRLIRKRRGHCLKCGYDLGHAEHDVCPECGDHAA